MLKKQFAVMFLSMVFFIYPAVSHAQNAVLYFSPSGGTFSQGQSFWAAVMVNTDGKAVNAVAAYFAYPEDRLEFLGVNTEDSPLTFWAEKNAASGKVNLAGGLPTPGFSGVKRVASVGFKVKTSSGSANLKFDQSSAVVTDIGNQNILNLANSGQANYNFILLPIGTSKPAATPQKTIATISPTPLPDSTVTPNITTNINREIGQVPEEKIKAIYQKNLIIILAIFLAISFIVAVLWTFLKKS